MKRITEELRERLEDYLQSEFSDEWHVSLGDIVTDGSVQKLKIQWGGHESTLFTITWDEEDEDFCISGKDISADIIVDCMNVINEFTKEKAEDLSSNKGSVCEAYTNGICSITKNMCDACASTAID